MTHASCFCSLRHSRRRQTQRWGNRKGSRAFHRSASFEVMEGRLLLSTVSFTTGSETVSESAGKFSVPVTVSSPPDGTPTVSAFASGFDDPVHLAFDAAGNLYVANFYNNTVSEVSPAGAVINTISGFDGPLGMAFDAAGNLYVGNINNETVSKVSPAGVVINTFSGFDNPVGLAFDSTGNLYVLNTGNDTMSEVTPAGVVSSFFSGLSAPSGLAFGAGNLYVANVGSDAVIKVSETATVPFKLGGTAVAGEDYSGVTASPLTFMIGQTTQSITGTLLSVPGSNRTLILTLVAPTGGTALVVAHKSPPAGPRLGAKRIPRPG